MGELDTNKFKRATLMKKSKNTNLKYRKKLNGREQREAWLGRIFIWIMIAITLFPVIAIVAASMAKGQSFTQSTIFPQQWTLENYINVIKKTDFIYWVRNSLLICTAVATLQLVLSVPAAFAFSKLKFKGRKKGLMSLLLLQMFPAAMALPAIIAVVYNLGLTDKPLVLILILAGGSAYNIWLLKGAVDGIPTDIVEAAYIDGASTVQVFSRIILPLLRNMMIVIFLFAFIAAYSEFIFTSSLIKDNSLQTVATGMRKFITNNFSANWTQYSAAAIMASLPLVALFMGCQKYISKGLVSGAVKG